MNIKGLEARMKPSVYGIGYLGGNLELKTSYNGKKCPIYHTWLRMLERCYSKKLHERFPSYKIKLAIDGDDEVPQRDLVSLQLSYERWA